MLSEKQISIIALSCSVIGFAAVMVFSALEEPVLVKISQAGEFQNSKIAVKARVISEFYSKNTLFLTLYDGNRLKAVMFNPSMQVLEIAEKDSQVMAFGRLQQNPNEKTLIVSELRKIA